MNCGSFQRKLHALLDDRLAPEDDPELQQHAWKCERCQRMLRGQQQLWMLLAEETSPTPSEDLASRVLAQVHQPVPRSRQTAAVPMNSVRLNWAWKWLAVAASLLLLLSPLAWNADERPAPRNQFGQQQTQPHSWSADQYASSDLQMLELEKKFGAFFQEVRRDPLNSVDEFTEPLRPITVSFGVTIDALRRTFPLPSKEGAQKPQAGQNRFDVYV